MFKKFLILILLFPLTANAEYGLSPLQEQQILLGHTCCYTEEVIQYVQYKNLPAINIQENKFIPTIKNGNNRRAKRNPIEKIDRLSFFPSYGHK